MTIKYIKKVEIKNLWNKYDIEWNLNEDINILAGINGIGKTTILNLIRDTIFGKFRKSITNVLLDDIKITFNTDQYIEYKKVANFKIDEYKKVISSTKFKKDFYEFLQNDLIKIKTVFQNVKIFDDNLIFFNFENTQMTPEELQEILKVALISTFDQRLQPYEAVKKLNNEVLTELDLEIYLLQERYLEYQLNIGKKAIKALSLKLSVNDINYKNNLFLDTIDRLFKATQKEIDRNESKLIFKSGTQVLTPYMLSSGEKQLIIILLTALLQEDKHCIFIMDEPEISLHTDWQEELIENIRNLNNNAQIILATHSPSMVLDGWLDKIFEVPEITTKIR